MIISVERIGFGTHGESIDRGWAAIHAGSEVVAATRVSLPTLPQLDDTPVKRMDSEKGI